MGVVGRAVKGATDPLRCGVVGTLRTGGLNPYADLDIAHDVAKRQLFEAPVSRGPFSLIEVSDELPGGAVAGRLRKDARLSNGAALAATVVARALNRSPWYEPLLEVKASGDRIVFSPKVKAFDVKSFLSSDRVRFGVMLDDKWLGTGPYRVTRTTPAGMYLEANPYYPRTPAITNILLRSYDPEDACAQIQGDLAHDALDLTAALSREELMAVRGVRKLFASGTSTALLWLNTLRLPEPLRQAISKGIDRFAVVSATYDNPMAFLASSILPPGMGGLRMRFGGDRRPSTERSLGDVELPDRPLVMLVVWGRRPYMPHPEKWGEEIRRQLGELGLEIELSVTSTLEEYQRELSKGDYDMVLGGWNAVSPSPSEFVDAILHSAMTPKGQGSAGCNYAWLRDDEMDGALQLFRSQPSRDTEDKLLRLLERTVPVIPLAYGATSIAARWNVEGIEPSDGAVFDFSRLRWGKG